MLRKWNGKNSLFSFQQKKETERAPTSADATLRVFIRAVLSCVIFGIRILINLTDGVFDVSVGLHGWCFQLEELPLSLTFGFIWTSNPHPSSEDSSAKISPGFSHHA